VADNDRQLMLSAARDALLAAFPNAWAIYVYGSFARGDESPASDIDLAVLLPEEENIDDLLGVMSAVSAHVHREVDLVDLRKVGDVLRREVLAEGDTLYTSRPDAVQKITSLQSCVARAREAYAAAGPGVRTNYNKEWWVFATLRFINTANRTWIFSTR
jgi:predicted nucleotidyltransferase